MSTLSWIGVWLLVAAAVVIVAEGVLAVLLGVAVARRSRALAEGLQSEQRLIEADIQKLRAAVKETQRLWHPYQRALRLLRHPLAIALIGSLARRRAGR
jgi:hypothetical protein